MNDKETADAIRLLSELLSASIEREKALFRSIAALREAVNVDARYDAAWEQAADKFPRQIDEQIEQLRQLVQKLSSSRKDSQS